jgi:hypothetical protein
MSLRKLLQFITPILFLSLMALLYYPTSSSVTRTFSLAIFLVIILLSLMLSLRSNPWRYISISIVVLIVAMLVLPGRAYDQTALQQANEKALVNYLGSPYVWGGESHRGIDCSGLVRRGMIEANFTRGLETLNPELLRRAANLWWNDTTARQLGEGYLSFTRQILVAPDINGIVENKLKPGDLAVTLTGVHILEYLGESKWIEADPNAHQVILVHTPTTNDWFRCPVRIVRWTQLN